MAYAYDAFDNLVAMRDPAGNSTTASFNIRGWRLSLNDPDTGSSAYWYDALGRMVAQTDAKGSTIWWSYDAIGRVVERANNGQTLDYFNYDPAHGLGKLWGAARYSYDGIVAVRALVCLRLAVAAVVDDDPDRCAIECLGDRVL